MAAAQPPLAEETLAGLLQQKLDRVVTEIIPDLPERRLNRRMARIVCSIGLVLLLFPHAAAAQSDPAVTIEPITEGARPVAPVSGLNTDMYQALERVSAQMYPGATLLPTMLGGGTDMAQLRVKGIQSYGIGPASTEDDTLKFGAHSDVERLLESSLHGLVEFTWRAIVEVAAKQ
jgi:hypothetical protein